MLPGWCLWWIDSEVAKALIRYWFDFEGVEDDPAFTLYSLEVVDLLALMLPPSDTRPLVYLPCSFAPRSWLYHVIFTLQSNPTQCRPSLL